MSSYLLERQHECIIASISLHPVSCFLRGKKKTATKDPDPLGKPSVIITKALNPNINEKKSSNTNIDISKMVSKLYNYLFSMLRPIHPHAKWLLHMQLITNSDLYMLKLQTTILGNAVIHLRIIPLLLSRVRDAYQNLFNYFIWQTT